MLEKLALNIWGFLLLAGLAFSACSQETERPVEVGSAQVELRSDLVLTEAQDPQSAALDQQDLDRLGRTSKPIQASRRIPLPEGGKVRQDSAYGSLNRYEFLPALWDKPRAGKPTSDAKDTVSGTASTVSLKYRVLAGKGFGVGAGERTEMVRPDDTHYYFPTVALKPTIEVSEHLEPAGEPFKSRKPLIFHSGATGFAHEPPGEGALSGRSPASGTTLVLAPIPETQVYLSSKPKTEVTLAPAENRLDLMNGNENLNRHRFYQRDAGPKF